MCRQFERIRQQRLQHALQYGIRRFRRGRMDGRGILALAHRGVTHVRGKDCVHPDIGLVIVRMISFPARESGQRARMAVR